MTDSIADETAFLRGLSKPLRSAGYDEISKRVNDEISKLGKGATFADLKEIDNKLGLPRGTSWEMSGFADYFAFEDKD